MGIKSKKGGDCELEFGISKRVGIVSRSGDSE